jgi:ketosteroid isomerase-like protein
MSRGDQGRSVCRAGCAGATASRRADGAAGVCPRVHAPERRLRPRTALLRSGVTDLDFAEHFAEEWAAAWNSRDLERILAHFADDVVFTSPKIVQFLGDPSGEVRGKEALRAYWAKGLQLLPDLRFTVEDVRASVETVVINYRNERGQAVAEVLTLRDGLVCRGLGAYGPAA